MKLIEIQKNLKAPKNQRNNFWNYNYRSCEDILEAVKPLLEESTLLLSDEVVEVGGKCYVKATATFIEWDKETKVTAYAREADTKKGMDEAQITWSASSYARKYALNGLFLIDDTKDPDATNDHWKKEQVKDKMTQKNYDDFVKFVEWKSAGEIMQHIVKAKAKYDTSDFDLQLTKLANG
jgi:hypothetical protein